MTNHNEQREQLWKQLEENIASLTLEEKIRFYNILCIECRGKVKKLVEEFGIELPEIREK